MKLIFHTDSLYLHFTSTLHVLFSSNTFKTAYDKEKNFSWIVTVLFFETPQFSKKMICLWHADKTDESFTFGNPRYQLATIGYHRSVGITWVQCVEYQAHTDEGSLLRSEVSYLTLPCTAMPVSSLMNQTKSKHTDLNRLYFWISNKTFFNSEVLRLK